VCVTTGGLEPPPPPPALPPPLPLVCVTTGVEDGAELGDGVDAAPLVDVVTGADAL